MEKTLQRGDEADTVSIGYVPKGFHAGASSDSEAETEKRPYWHADPRSGQFSEPESEERAWYQGAEENFCLRQIISFPQ